MKTQRCQMFNEINITPLTDIFLVLLITMMVVAPMLDTSGLRLSVPSAAPVENVTEDPKTIELVIDSTGNYSIEGTAVSKMFLSNKLRELKAENPDGVIVKANPDASHEVLTFAMDAAQMAGITKMAVMADESSAQGE